MSVMTDPAVVAGLSILGIPSLPDVDVLNEHIRELDTAAAYHRRLVIDGGHAYQLAGVNDGPATDALRTFVTGHEGTLPQAGDLAARLTTTADGLRVSRDTIEWIAGLLAGVAVAAGAAVLAAPQLLPRLVSMARRFVSMLRTILNSVGRIFRQLLKTPRARRIETAADRLHDKWRANYRLREGDKPRIKVTTDEAWIRRHGTDRVDIAASRNRDLPTDLQKENVDSATSALRIVENSRKRGVDTGTEDFMETASSDVHVEWLKRNGEWAPKEQKVPYSELSEFEKEKDREVVRVILGL
ncbi:hypothetical protein [Streptosporangium lutulentum]|uniref:Uncharacterized protein n=1 Tax=Streptosporangium lutulentum TaxID=1461250 RepID=A0ABT9QUV1_9ACTN|nr:hypothetical protein [Streptosporangium lutulentum]MDP9850068.1 hypothetical protein [Streptosporangium lutulentum]